MDPIQNERVPYGDPTKADMGFQVSSIKQQQAHDFEWIGRVDKVSQLALWVAGGTALAVIGMFIWLKTRK
ncbi:hypothetical protein BKI52_32990 [marine bacterium AO1-C]|nr:hypothetical protein BKI52_32990 [marine bacterium AO1-C]